MGDYRNLLGKYIVKLIWCTCMICIYKLDYKYGTVYIVCGTVLWMVGKSFSRAWDSPGTNPLPTGDFATIIQYGRVWYRL